MIDDREVTTRRTLEQIVHTAQEALSTFQAKEDLRCVVDDLHHAKGLIDHALKTILNTRGV
jgi:hypothetical protein